MRLTIRWQTLGAVLRDAWPIWLFVGGLIITCVVSNLLSKTRHDAVLYTGTMLQIFGLTTVAFGLRQMRRMFDRPSFKAAMLNWFRRLAAAFTSPEPISLQLSGVGSMTAVGDLRVVVGPKSGATLDERVSILEKNLTVLRDELDAKLQMVGRELGTVKESIEYESQKRGAADEKTARKIEEMAVGGLHLEWVGLFWLYLGVMAGSIPDVIAEWLP